MEIQFTEQVLTDTASSLRGNVAKLRSLLDDATSNINKTQSFWDGPSAQAMRTKYDALKTNFEPFCQFVEGMAKFLDESAMEQATKERKIEKAAADLSTLNM